MIHLIHDTVHGGFSIHLGWFGGQQNFYHYHEFHLVFSCKTCGKKNNFVAIPADILQRCVLLDFRYSNFKSQPLQITTDIQGISAPQQPKNTTTDEKRRLAKIGGLFLANMPGISRKFPPKKNAQVDGRRKVLPKKGCRAMSLP